MVKRTLCVVVMLGVALEASAAERMVGVRPADGVAMLVKQLAVAPGTEIHGIEFGNNDARSIFPEIVVAEDVGTAFQEGRVLATARDIAGGADGIVRVTFNPPVVTQSGACFVGVRFPNGGTRVGAGNGAGIAASDLEEPSGSFLATGADGDLQPILVNLDVRFVVARQGKATTQGVQVRTFLHARMSSKAPSGVEIRFGVEQAAPVRLRVFDVAGRVVRSLVDEPLSRGEYERTWDGRNDNGRGIAAGIYLVQLQTGSALISRKVVFAK